MVVMTVQEQVLDAIRRMSVADLVELVRALEGEMAGRGGGATVDDAGRSGVPISLRDLGADRIAVIKAVREITDLGLREAMGMVDTGGGTGAADNDEGPETAGVPAKPRTPLPSDEAAERLAVPKRPRQEA